MIHEGILKLTETHFGGHPCCVVSISYKLCGPFHDGNTGSNPVGDAKPFQAVASDSPLESRYTEGTLSFAPNHFNYLALSCPFLRTEGL